VVRAGLLWTQENHVIVSRYAFSSSERVCCFLRVACETWLSAARNSNEKPSSNTNSKMKLTTLPEIRHKNEYNKCRYVTKFQSELNNRFTERIKDSRACVFVNCLPVSLSAASQAIAPTIFPYRILIFEALKISCMPSEKPRTRPHDQMLSPPNGRKRLRPHGRPALDVAPQYPSIAPRNELLDKFDSASTISQRGSDLNLSAGPGPHLAIDAWAIQPGLCKHARPHKHAHCTAHATDATWPPSSSIGRRLPRQHSIRILSRSGCT
jgi:hypothetical protein